MPVSGTYLNQVNKLQSSLMNMGELCAKLIGDAVAALVANDEVLAEEIIRRDNDLDQLEDEHEEWVMRMIALNQPVAQDLRLLIAFLRINEAIERAGDIAVNLAQAVNRTHDLPRIQPYVDIPHNYELARNMWDGALRAFSKMDESLARKTREQDDLLDKANRETIQQLLQIGERSPQHLHMITNMIGVSKALERIGDLSVDICDEVVFVREGELRHARFQRESA